MISRLGFVAGSLALGLAIAPNDLPRIHWSSAAFAQAADMGGIARSESISARVTVKEIDMQTRSVTLQGASGDTFVLKAGEQVRNLAQIKPGDSVIIHYYTSTAFVVAPAGTKLPENSLTAGAARAAPGEKPGAVAGTRMVVSGLVVAVDPAHHTISLVDPQGGKIRTVDVVTPEGQRSMKRVRVGDTITAIITDAVLVAVERAA